MQRENRGSGRLGKKAHGPSNALFAAEANFQVYGKETKI